MKDSLNIVIGGATGYVGLELIKILNKHPKVKIKYLCAQKSAGKSIIFFDKTIKKKLPKISKINKVNWSDIDVLFTALPNGESQKISKIIPNRVKLIDLSADFRIKNTSTYKKWYGIEHANKKLNKVAIYAISEFYRKELKSKKVIACPGCYPTSILLPLVPILKNKLVKSKNIIVDSKSGYSGAGKGIHTRFKKKHLYESVSAYGVGSHRHMAEIDQELLKISGKNINISFTPHLIPMFRGILSTIYVQPTSKNNAKTIYNLLKKVNKNNYFVKIAKFNSHIGTGDVMNTNFCEISVCKNRDDNGVIIVSVIDNLIKGAAGQAVQNMNISYGINESLGLK